MRLRLLFSALLWTPAVSQFVCTICENGGSMNKPSGLVTTPEGQTATCASLSRHVATLHQESCQKLQSLTGAPCGCPGFDSTTDAKIQTTATGGTTADISQPGSYECSICAGGEMTNPNGFTLSSEGLPISCQELHDSRDTILETACARVQGFASVPCGCEGGSGSTTDTSTVIAALLQGGSESYECSVCGNGFVGKPDGIVYNDRGLGKRCSELEANRAVVPPNMCVPLQQTALNPCGCDYNQLSGGADQTPFVCSVCGDGLVMANPTASVSLVDGQDEVLCSALEVNSHKFSQNQCPNIQRIAQESCGCVAPEIVPRPSDSSGLEVEEVLSQCSICGDGEMTLPDGIVTTRQGTSARCFDLDQNPKEISQTACKNIQAMSSEPCGCTTPYQPPSTNILNDITVTAEEESPSLPDDEDSSVCHVCGGSASTITNPGQMVQTTTGLFTCFSIFNAGLSGSIPMEDCGTIQEAVTTQCGCYVDGPTPSPTESPFECSVCADDLILTNPGGVIDASNNITCGQYQSEGARGRLSEDQCSVLQETSGDACGCQPPLTQPPTAFRCEICGRGRMVGRPGNEFLLPNFLTMNCGDLQQRADDGNIHEYQCRQYEPLAQQYCGCIDRPYTEPTNVETSSYECNICGRGLQVTKPEGIVVSPSQPQHTCAELMNIATLGQLDINQCYQLHPYVQGPCGCVAANEGKPDSSPSFPVSAPTKNRPELDTEQGDCFSDFWDIQVMEKGIMDTSIKRKYVLCPGKTYEMGSWTDDEQIKGGQPFLALRPNVIYQCGDDGMRSNHCVLKGGDFGLASYDGVIEGIHETVPGVEVRGLTFESQNMFSVLLKSAGDITFTDCAFKSNSKNTPVLLQWDEKESSVDHRRLQYHDQSLATESEEQLKQIVTFQDCVFRDNYITDVSTSFPGIIENTFHSELNVRNCLFQDNVYGSKNNPTGNGYAIRSFGPLTLEATCFIDNEFLNHAPVLVYGAQYSALNNYVESSRTDLTTTTTTTCELGALFSSQNDMAETTPACESSDANTCSFTQNPTFAPTVTPPTKAPVEYVRPDFRPKSQREDGASSAASATRLTAVVGVFVLSTVLAF
eukprot:CAMPEP_0172371682 /NCGR_PEP_ID=MMETSP1060-20121228/44266_1 /TAXON_ID=37318 /ORGANISM="Pseudo-nitzschia pungens, Strain cf. cingulata" /LENGTH=1090 /DNA_ID=CAMNT_0013097395 /DNA_START=80 /DNA_END=3352 /DNA_ORIENTATION=+